MYYAMCLFTAPTFTAYSLCLSTERWPKLSRYKFLVLRRDGLAELVTTKPNRHHSFEVSVHAAMPSSVVSFSYIKKHVGLSAIVPLPRIETSPLHEVH